MNGHSDVDQQIDVEGLGFMNTTFFLTADIYASQRARSCNLPFRGISVLASTKTSFKPVDELSTPWYPHEMRATVGHVLENILILNAE